MAQLSVNLIDDAGVAIDANTVSAEAGGDSFLNRSNGRTFLLVENTDASSHDVTLTAQQTEVQKDGFGTLDIGDVVVSVPAGESRLIAVPPGSFNDSEGLVQASYSDQTGMNVGAFRVANP